MKPTIDFNEHLDAQARAYEIGKAEGIAQQANACTACCGNFESCSTPCVPRAEHFKEQRDQLIAAFEQAEFRRRPAALDYGVYPADIARITKICKNIRSSQTS